MTTAGSTEAGLLVLAGDELRDVLAGLDPLRIVTEVFRKQGKGEARVASEASLYWQTREGKTARTLNMPGLLDGEAPVVGTKVINSSFANKGKGLPRASGLTILFEPETARPICVLEAGRISALRTAAVSVLAIELMGCSELDSLAVVGTGRIGACHAEMVCERVGGLRELRLYDADRDSAVALAADLEASSLPDGPRPVVADSAHEAIAGAAVVIACTTVTDAYIPAGWLAPGALAVNVSLDDLSADAIFAAGRLVVDSWSLVKEDERRLLGRLYRAGSLVGPGDSIPAGGRRVDAEIKDVLLDPREGRRDDEEIVVVNPFGMGVLDLALAQAAHRLAVDRGIGQTVAF
jgi:N-[(2S)-2-amino-2-carboxyethyl]-L-glutamate dehydrogenase